VDVKLIPEVHGFVPGNDEIPCPKLVVEVPNDVPVSCVAVVLVIEIGNMGFVGARRLNDDAMLGERNKSLLHVFVFIQI
jgi:hypothetical protein